MHSLVEFEGSVATASTRRGIQVDRKVNLLVGGLCHFDVSITVIIVKLSGLVKVYMRWMFIILADLCQQMVNLCREMKVLASF